VLILSFVFWFSVRYPPIEAFDTFMELDWFVVNRWIRSFRLEILLYQDPSDAIIQNDKDAEVSRIVRAKIDMRNYPVYNASASSANGTSHK